MPLTEQQVEQIAKAAARAAVEQMLIAQGMEPEDVREMQKDFAYLRAQRKASEQVSTWTRRALVLFLISSACTLLVTGVKAAFTDLIK